MDPYVVVKVGEQRKTSSIQHGAGRFPSWNDEIVLERRGEEFFEVEVWDYESLTRDDLVGEVRIPLQRIIDLKTTNEWYELTYRGKAAGQIKIEVIWELEKIETRSFSSDLLASMKNVASRNNPGLLSGAQNEMHRPEESRFSEVSRNDCLPGVVPVNNNSTPTYVNQYPPSGQVNYAAPIYDPLNFVSGFTSVKPFSDSQLSNTGDDPQEELIRFSGEEYFDDKNNSAQPLERNLNCNLYHPDPYITDGPHPEPSSFTPVQPIHGSHIIESVFSYVTPSDR